MNDNEKLTCPDCGAKLAHMEACITCPQCGWSECEKESLIKNEKEGGSIIYERQT